MEDITQVFINLYRGFPCLYDTSLSVYKSKEISKKAYLDLASSSGMSVAQVKAKIKNLRTCYTRHLWSLKEYNEKKASGMDVKPPCWRYFPDMDFLRSHCTIRRVTFAEVCGSAGEKAMRFVGEEDTGTGAGETNGQAPEQMRSLEQRRLEVQKGSVLEFSPNVLRRWKAVRKTQSLTTNTDTAQFLLEFFERERAKVDSRCVLCHRPLTLYCLVCDEPAPETHNASTSPPPQKHNTETVEKRPRRKVAQKHKKVRTKEPLRKQTVSSGKVRLNKSKDGSKESSREETLNSAEMCMVVKKEEEDGEGFDQVQLLMSVDDEADSEDSKKACYRLTERQQMIEDGLAKTEEEEKDMEECSERTLTSGDTCAVDVKTEESESQRVMSVDDFEPDSLIEVLSLSICLGPVFQSIPKGGAAARFTKVPPLLRHPIHPSP
ncbi:uncharacterized protein [Littorina saxatilis]|uniref:uncharacterized protein n=1 Tax=Littorina saxatilis TaxID=31220 RepID=UPI0038B63940